MLTVVHHLDHRQRLNTEKSHQSPQSEALKLVFGALGTFGK